MTRGVLVEAFFVVVAAGFLAVVFFGAGVAFVVLLATALVELFSDLEAALLTALVAAAASSVLIVDVFAAEAAGFLEGVAAVDEATLFVVLTLGCVLVLTGATVTAVVTNSKILLAPLVM